VGVQAEESLPEVATSTSSSPFGCFSLLSFDHHSTFGARVYTPATPSYTVYPGE